MNQINNFDLLEWYCRGRRCWGLLISSKGDNDGRRNKRKGLALAAPWVVKDNFLFEDLLSGETVFVHFDTESMAREAFDQTVGDDGPSRLNDYNGPVRVYACLAGPDGVITENT